MAPHINPLRRMPGTWPRAGVVLWLALCCWASAAQADAVATLRDFAREVKTGRAAFTQTVTSPDGSKRKTSSGRFEFARPDRFRFVYARPFEQQIVADGQRVWLYDVDLNQVTVRPMARALGSTPAALLAGAAFERDFELSALPASDGLEWAQALPRAKEGTIQSLRVGFQGKSLAALEIVDAFGQRSMIRFTQVESNPVLGEELFRFVPPKGVDLIEQ
jgi:outer membrane lipoprotein carrier protein